MLLMSTPSHSLLSLHLFAYFGLFPFHSSCVSVIWTWTSPNRLSTQLFSPQDDYSLCSVHSLWYVLATSLCVCIALSYLFYPFLVLSACLCEAYMYMCKCTCTCLFLTYVVSHGKTQLLRRGCDLGLCVAHMLTPSLRMTLLRTLKSEPYAEGTWRCATS